MNDVEREWTRAVLVLGGLGCFAEALIQGVFEADELSDKCVITAVSLISLGGQELIEVELRKDIVLWRWLHETGFCQSRTSDTDKAGWDRVAVFTMIIESLSHTLGTRQVGNQVMDLVVSHG